MSTLTWTVSNTGYTPEWTSVGTKGRYCIKHGSFIFAVSVNPSRHEGHEFDRVGHSGSLSGAEAVAQLWEDTPL
jgi:hypothetical protein